MKRAVAATIEPADLSMERTLTREQILVLTGKKLDAAIAERLMGWTPWRSPCVPLSSTEPDCWRTRSWRNPTYAMWGWRPSKDHNSMAKVVARMNRDGYRLQVHQIETGEWRALFHRQTKMDQWAVGQTLPCAVARAALLAVQECT